MKQNAIALRLLPIFLLVLPVLAGAVERSDTIRKVYRFGMGEGERLVIVDNVFGSIHVDGYDGDEVRMSAKKKIVARSDRHAAEAEEEVTLEIFEDEDRIEFYVDGPFRDRGKRGFSWRGYDREGYKVIYDFDLKVPRGCSVELSTVNEGDIVVQSLDGNFDVRNVNGGIEMKGLCGSGEAGTVNGGMQLEFDENPREDCSFDTINGDVKLYFSGNLSADFYMKTMNGEAFTDFEVASLPGKTKTVREGNGHKVYKVSRMSGVRAGRGGPEIEIHTLNGDMFILSK